MHVKMKNKQRGLENINPKPSNPKTFKAQFALPVSSASASIPSTPVAPTSTPVTPTPSGTPIPARHKGELTLPTHPAHQQKTFSFYGCF